MKLRLTRAHVAFTCLALAYGASAWWLLTRGGLVDGERTKIRIAHWQIEYGPPDGLAAVIKRYEELRPDIEVEQVLVPGRIYRQWLRTNLVGGTGADLIEYGFFLPGMKDVPVRYFEPITALMEQPNPYNRGTPLEGVPWRDTFIDGMTSPDNYVQAFGQYYGVSMTTGMHRIVYNRALLQTITGRAAPPHTYREFLAICDRIQAYAKAHGLKLAPLANSRTTHIALTGEIVSNLSTGLAGRIDYQHRLKFDPQSLAIAYLRGEWDYDAPELTAGFEVLREIGAQCMPGFLQRERDTALTDFVTGRAVMVIAPSWEATSLQQLCQFELGAFRFPFPREDDPAHGRYAHGPFGEGQVMTGMPFYLNRNTKHRAEALDFLHFMSSREGSTIFTRVSNWLPIVTGVQPSEFAAQFQLQPDGYYWQTGFMGPSNHTDAQSLMLSVLHTLWGSDGSVETFRAVLRDGMGDKVRDGLRRDMGAGLESVRREDVAGAALAELAARGERPETLRLLPLTNEINLYQARVTLMATKAGAP